MLPPEPALRRAVAAGGAYIVDLDRLEMQLARFRSDLGAAPVDLVFPVKTLALPPVLEIFARHGFAFDVSNGVEAAIASGFASRGGFLNGPLALRGIDGFEPPVGTWVPVLSTAAQVHAGLRGRWRAVGLRVDSSAFLGALPNRLPSRFGLPVEELQRAAAGLRKAGVTVEWLHVHHGSDVLKVEDYWVLLEGLLKLASSLGTPNVNLGGGQFACVSGGTDLASLCAELARALPSGHRLAIEGGGVHLRDCVRLEAEVVDVQIREPLMTITLATCLTASLQWSKARADVRLPEESLGVSVIRVTGASCDEGDALSLCFPDASAERRRAPRPGDWLTLHDVSPYAIGRRFAFNGIPAASVFVIRAGGLVCAEPAADHLLSHR